MGPHNAKPMSSRGRILRSLDHLPAFSPIINRLLSTLAKQHVSFVELGELIEKDAVLAGNLLRVVNSAMYGLRGTVSAVPHAIALMGLDKLRNTVLALSVARMWRHTPSTRNWSGAAFNLHSAATGTLADLIVQRVPAAYPEGAFTAGLFHDFGKLLIASEAPEAYDALCAVASSGASEWEECERELLGITHAELGAMAVSHWNLPQPIRMAVEHHHSPGDGGDGLRSLSQVILAADQYVNLLGITVPPVRLPEFAAPQEALAALGMTGGIPTLIEEFDAELEILRSVLEGEPCAV